MRALSAAGCAALLVLVGCGQAQQQHTVAGTAAPATHQSSAAGTAAPATPTAAATQPPAGSPRAGGAGAVASTSALPTTSVVPAAGKYAYTLTTNGKPMSSQLTVSAPQTTAQGSVDQQSWGSGGGAQQGSNTEYLAWEPSGVFITEVSGGTSTTYDCKLNPPALLLQEPVAVGASWNVNSSCTLNGGTVRWTGSGRVVGTENREVGTTNVACYVIQSTLSIVFTFATGSYTVNSSGKSWMAPSLGLQVRNESTSTSSSSSGKQTTSTTVMQLDSTRPG